MQISPRLHIWFFRSLFTGSQELLDMCGNDYDFDEDSELHGWRRQCQQWHRTTKQWRHELDNDFGKVRRVVKGRGKGQKEAQLQHTTGKLIPIFKSVGSLSNQQYQLCILCCPISWFVLIFMSFYSILLKKIKSAYSVIIFSFYNTRWQLQKLTLKSFIQVSIPSSY